jgi:hypothetical protein
MKKSSDYREWNPRPPASSIVPQSRKLLRNREAKVKAEIQRNMNEWRL